MHAPEWSDSEDSLFGDDADYQEFKDTIKRIKSEQHAPVVTEAEIKQQRLETLYYSISNGDISQTLEILENDGDVNCVLKDGYSPILLSVCYGNPEMTRVLIEKGGNVNAAKDFTTALMMACSCPDYTAPFDQSFEVVKLLVENGANVKAINRKRMNALMFASSTGNLEAVKYLLPLSDKNAVDNQRWNALFWAIGMNQVEVVKYLAREGFDTTIVDVRGNNLQEIARISDCQEILAVISGGDKELNGEIEVPDLDFEKHFKGLKKGQKPMFSLDIYNILNSVRCGNLFANFIENDISLEQFLSMNDDDLKRAGILLPFQRKRILTGLYRFHKYPYHPRSLWVVPLNAVYSNIDVATQLMSAIKQFIAMESSLIFIRKQPPDDDTKEKRRISQLVQDIKKKIAACKSVSNKLKVKANQWDQVAVPADLITKHSTRTKFPWRKIVFSLSVISAIAMFRFCK